MAIQGLQGGKQIFAAKELKDRNKEIDFSALESVEICFGIFLLVVTDKAVGNSVFLPLLLRPPWLKIKRLLVSTRLCG